MNGHRTEELSAVVGVGVTGTAEQYLSGGGRIEFNQDGTLTVSGNVAAGGGVSVDAGAGAGGFDASITVAAPTASWASSLLHRGAGASAPGAGPHLLGTVTGSLFGQQVANEDVTYQQLLEMARRAAG